MKHLTLLFLVRHDEVLLAMKKRGFGEGRWNGVGGKVEPGETVKQAVIRECQEEIEVTPTQFHKVADITFDEMHFKTRDIHHAEVFIADKWTGEPSETEEMAPKWFKISEIPYEQMWPDDKFWLNDVLHGKKYIAKFRLDGKDEVVEHNMKEVDTFNESK